jgi:hypothetical protein
VVHARIAEELERGDGGLGLHREPAVPALALRREHRRLPEPADLPALPGRVVEAALVPLAREAEQVERLDRRGADGQPAAGSDGAAHRTIPT